MTTATMTTMNDTTTENKLIEMLTENTGRHFLDSGGAYGRHWERNQGVDFEAQPTGSLEFWKRGDDVDIIATLNVFHFLKERLEYNPELDQQYREFVESNDLDFDIQSVSKFLDSLPDITGIYGEGDPLCVNTYNGEDLLSQIIQYFYWTDDNGPHVLLQIHGGCDVRGGYTAPVAFDCDESIFENVNATIYCEDCNQSWDTDDGSHWYPDGCCGNGYQELQSYPTVDDKPEYPDQPHPDQKLLFDMTPSKPNAGVLWIDDDQGHCPYCSGILRI